MVARRLVPLLVAAAVAFAPVALVACQVSCVSQANMRAAAGNAHHHHHVANTSSAQNTAPAGHVHDHASSASTPAPSAVIMGGPRSCDHDSTIAPGLLNGAKVASDQLAPVAIPASPAYGTSHTSTADVNWLHPPGDRIDRSSRTTVLRI
jgi:hypothetical protein